MTWFTVRTILVRVLIFAALGFAVFKWVGGFGNRQAILLAICLALPGSYPFWPKPSDWEPFEITFVPDFPKMLHSVGILEDGKQWKDLLDARESPHPENDVQRHGHLWCTVLAPSHFFWWPSHHRSKLDLWLLLDAVTYTVHDVAQERERTACPKFFIDTRQGYCFGLIVEKLWWSNVQGSRPEVRQSILEVREMPEDKDYCYGTLHLVMGVIPYRDICGWYYNRWPEPVRKCFAFAQRREEAMSKFGWSIKPRNWEIRREPEILVHQYMEIELRDIGGWECPRPDAGKVC